MTSLLLRITNRCPYRKNELYFQYFHFQLYPSDPIAPDLYGVIKAHKPEKCYPMRAIVLTVGTPPYVISQYLVELIQ